MSERCLIIGGAGFIGTNLASHYLKMGKSITIFDNLSRLGAINNVKWLKKCYHNRISIVKGDIRIDQRKLFEDVEKADIVFHLAAQVAVTTSVIKPREDFETNALGTFNVLEAIRCSRNKPILIYASTNKVYGKMDDLKVIETNGRYRYSDLRFGVCEKRPLDFHSPYGCSKGAGDQYVRDYARIYGLRTIVFRQSCIYGRYQFGIEDQGWVAWFAIAALLNKPISIYGDGKQVRDILYIDDLIEAFNLGIENIETTTGQVYNIGGGPENTLSVLELLRLLEKLCGKKLNYSFSDWRPGDQLVYVSDVRKAKSDFGWLPRTTVIEGVKKLMLWIGENQEIISETILR
ncbi:MAG: GDP-mannose 4,6-dehydratase [Candidatus Hodarchaeota archaeon]